MVVFAVNSQHIRLGKDKTVRACDFLFIESDRFDFWDVAVDPDEFIYDGFVSFVDELSHNFSFFEADPVEVAVIGLVSFVKTWVLVHFLLMLFLELFIHLFEVLDGGGCNEESFVVQMMINFVALLDSGNGVDFHLDMGLVVDENLADMLKKVVDRACAFI